MSKGATTEITAGQWSLIDSIARAVNSLYEMSEKLEIEEVRALKEGLAHLANMTQTLIQQAVPTVMPPQNLELSANKKLVSELIVLEDDPIVVESLRYMAKQKNKNINVYTGAKDLFAELTQYDKSTPICLDYHLGAEKNGAEVAQELFNAGYNKLFLVSGYDLTALDIPSFVTILPNKREVWSLLR